MAGAGLGLSIAHALEPAATGGIFEKDVELLKQPGDEITQAPAHHAVDIGNGTILDSAGQGSEILGVQPQQHAAPHLNVNQHRRWEKPRADNGPA